MISIQSIASSLHKQLDHVAPLENVLSFAKRQRRTRKRTMTLHLVPVGGILDWNEFGDEALSAIVLACYDADSCSFQTVATVDYTDEMKSALEELSDYMRPNKDNSYDMGATCTMMCDIWFDPVQVWEVEAGIQYLRRSDNFTAATLKSGESGQGIGFVSRETESSSCVRFVRSCCDEWDGIGVEEATTSDFVLRTFVEESSPFADR